MKKLLAIFIFTVVSSGAAFAETVALSTYYPAPFGAYDRLRLVPRNPPGGIPPCNGALEGLLYYDDTENLIKVCKNPGGFDTVSGVWTQNNIDASNADVYLTELTLASPRDVNVGIGTITPGANLHLYDASAAPILLLESGVDNDAMINFDSNRTGSNDELGVNSYYWNGNSVAQIGANAGTDTGNKDVAHITFRTRDIADAIPQERLRIDQSGNIGIGTTIPAENLTIDGGGSDVSQRINIDNTGGGSAWLRLTEQQFQGGFLRYDAGGTEDFHIGVHDALNSVTASDIVAITIERTNGNVTIEGDGAGGAPGTPEELNVRGGMMLRDDNANWGRLMVEFNAGGGGGYYAVYAP